MPRGIPAEDLKTEKLLAAPILVPGNVYIYGRFKIQSVGHNSERYSRFLLIGHSQLIVYFREVR